MKKQKHSLILLVVVTCMFAQTVYASVGVTVTGNTNTTPNLAASYTSLALALADLNAVTAMTGPVILTLAAGTSETAPVKGFTIGSATLNAVLSATNTVTIVKAGGTVTLNAGTGTATPTSASPDGILKIVGADFITIDGLTFTDGNTTNPSTMEFGVGLFKLNQSDGARYNTIQHCIFNMKRINNASATAPMVEGSVGILVINANPTAAVTALTPATAAGTNSYNKFYGNTLNDGNYGIVLSGFAATTPFTAGDTGNDIGGSSPPTGNTILNFGGASAAANPSAGIRTNNQWDINISYNTVNNNNGSGVNHPNTLHGIYGEDGTNANITISNNTVTVKGAGTTQDLDAIENQVGNNGTTNTVILSNNIVENCTYTTATTGYFYGLWTPMTAGTTQCTGNIIRNNSASGTGSFICLDPGGATTLSVYNNSIFGNTKTCSATSSVSMYCLYSSLSSLNAHDNLIYSNNISTTGGAYSCTIYGCYGGYGNTTILNNQIYDLNITGSCTSTGSAVYGVYIYNYSGSTSVSGISLNYVHDLNITSTGGGSIYGVFAQFGSVANASRNKICNLTAGAAGGYVYGIYISIVDTIKVSNNMVANLFAPASGSDYSVCGMYFFNGKRVNIYYNTVFLNATSTGTLFGSTALYASYPTLLDLRNNLLVNTSTPAGTGITSAFKYGGTISTANYVSTSNNNYYFAGTPSSSRVIFQDATGTYSTLANFQSLVSPRDNFSLTGGTAPVFQSTSCSSASFLHMNPAASVIESGAYPIDGYSNDFDNNPRQGTAGYPVQMNGGGFMPDIGADEYDGIPNNSCAIPAPGNTLADINNICLGQPVTLSLQNSITGTGITFQWQSSSDGLAYVDITGAMRTTFTTQPARSTFYRCIVTCHNGPVSVSSTPIHIAFANSILSTTPDTCCGYGSVSLMSTGSTGTVRWYASPSGGTPLGTGSTFATPVIHSTTSYYAATEVTGTTGAVGAVTNGIGTGSSTQSSDCPLFDVYSMVNLQGVYVYPGAAGNVVLKISDKFGTVLQTVTYPVTSTNINVKTYIPVNLIIPAGTGYRIYMASGTVNLYRNTSGAAYPYTIPGVISITGNSAGGTYAGYYYYYYDWQVNTFCSSARSEVVANVLPAPDLTVSSNQTVCNAQVATLTVLSTLSNFDTYTWSPAANLFTDAACTMPYNGISSITTLYFKTAIANTTAITCTALKTATGCINSVTSSVTTLPSRPDIIAVPENICNSGLSVISLSPATGWGDAAFQWQTSPDNLSFSDIPGATNANYSTPVLTSPTYYKLRISNSAGSLCMALPRTVTVFNPQITSTTDGGRCNTGPVEIGATGTDGELKWYTGSSGWGSIGTGSPFFTPTIAATTTFYVDAETHLNGTVNIGAGSLTSYSPNPFYHAYGGAKTQYLIQASELLSTGLTAGNLTSVSFEFVSNAGQTYNSFSLSMGHTSLNALVSTLQSNLTTVYTAASVTPPSGIYTVPFTIPFTWDGASNLIIETCWSNNNTGGNYVYIKCDNTSYVSTLYYRANSLTAPVLCAGTAASGSYTMRPKMTFDGQVLCASPRSAVIATVVPPPAISITGGQTICANDIYPMNVTTPLSNFDTYTWSPATNLYTDPSCTIGYVPLSSATAVYVKSPAGSVTTYTCTATNFASNCINTAQATVTTLPPLASINSSLASLCHSGSVVLSLSPATGWGSATFLWQNSTDSLTYTNISGATTTTYTTPSVSATTYYRMSIKNGTAAECLSPRFKLVVENPQVASTTPGSRCGPGTVSLQATLSGGGILKWYSSAAGSTPVGTGSPFVTPVISATTTYYVAAAGTGFWNEITGQTYASGSSSTTFSNYGIVFSTTRDVVLNTATIYTAGSGTVTIALLNSSGTEIAVTSPIAVSGGAYTMQVLNLGFYIPVGTNYRLLMKAYTGVTSMYYEPPNYSYFPYTSASGAMVVTSGWKNSAVSTSNYWFYNLNITTGCISARTPVVATISPPPAVTAAALPSSVCAGFPSTLSATSSNQNYIYTWIPGNLTGAAQTVNPATTTTYTVTASVPGATCSTTATATVTVLPTPAPVTITPAAPVMVSGTVQQLDATGGTVSGVSILSENFNAATNNWTLTNNSTGGTPANAAWTLRANGYVYSSYGTWHSNDNSQFYLTNSEAQGSGGTTATILRSPPFSTAGYSAVNIGFYYCFYEISSGISTGKAEVSTDGTNWTTLTTINSNSGTVGAFASALIPLTAPFLSQPVVYLRFKYDAVYRYFWGIDNVSVTGTQPASITWSPVTDLYSDMPASAPYTGQVLPTVYAKPLSNITYTATSTMLSNGCSSSKTVMVTVTPAPLALAGTVTDVTGCYGNANGSVTTTVSGGVAPYNYQWSNAETTSALSGLAAGGYSVSVTDAASTTATGSWIIQQPPDLSISAQVMNAGCPDSHDGSLWLNVTGGTGGYGFLWSNAASTEGISALAPGNYSVTVTDGNGCSKSGTYAVGINDPVCTNISVTGTATGKVCYNAHDTIIVAGTDTPFIVAVPGDSVTFIAGQSILFKPGTQISGGAFMHGYIDTVFCQQADAPVVIMMKVPDDLQPPGSPVHFILYPNPTSGNFTIVQQYGKQFSAIRVEIFSMDGGKRMTEWMIDGKKHEFGFEQNPSGLYLVKIVAGDYIEFHKLVKTR